jgi:hypothetical protein
VSKGIIDSHALMEVLQGEAEEVCSAEPTFPRTAAECVVHVCTICTRISRLSCRHKIRQLTSHTSTRACDGVRCRQDPRHASFVLLRVPRLGMQRHEKCLCMPKLCRYVSCRPRPQEA